mgnify:CR=1 FL=1
MYILILLFPLLNFFTIFLLGFYLGRLGCCYFSVIGITLSFLTSILIFFEVVINQAPVTLKLYNWICIDVYSIQIGFLFDSICSIMFFIITFISLLVHIYSMDYLKDDPYISRFFAYLSLFTFFMLFLVSSDNLVQLFMGWEGVGLSSYLLINFWFTRILANKAALKAMIINRIADVFLLIGICIVFLKFKTTDFLVISTLIPFIIVDQYFFIFKTFYIIDLISFFIFIGAIGKSAQVFFHTWLPDAMEGPTPVSALLHAATMVTAGVFLIIRCSFIIEYSENVLHLLTIIGSISTFFAGLVAMYQYDIKRIIAYSTCSQLGYMFISCGFSNYHLAIFHLFNHAFFKALLFLSAGYIIHTFFDEQDMRKYGGKFLNILPLTYIYFIIGSFAIMGFPFLTGFYSKELIIFLGSKYYIINSSFCFLISVLSALFTAIYSIKIILYSFISRKVLGYKSIYKVIFNNYSGIEDAEDWMMFSMSTLAIASIIFGYLFNDIFISVGSFVWNNSIYVDPSHFNYYIYYNLPYNIKDIPLYFSIISLFILIYNNYYIFYIANFGARLDFIRFWYSYLLGALINCTMLIKYFHIILEFVDWSKSIVYHDIAYIIYNAFFFNDFYNNIFILFYKFSYNLNVKFIDKGFFEYFGPFSFYNLKKYFINNFNIYFFFKLSFSIFIKILILLLVLLFLDYCLLDPFLLNNLGLIAIFIFFNIYNKD